MDQLFEEIMKSFEDFCRESENFIAVEKNRADVNEMIQNIFAPKEK